MKQTRGVTHTVGGARSIVSHPPKIAAGWGKPQAWSRTGGLAPDIPLQPELWKAVVAVFRNARMIVRL